MNILIGGDLVPTQSNQKYFDKSSISELLGNDLLDIWLGATARFINLEAPLVDGALPSNKWGPCLKATISTIAGIKALQPTLIALANNHIMDYGNNGLYSTIELLNTHDIPFVGVGDEVVSASKPYVLELFGRKVGVYNCAENEFSVATEVNPGANPFDPLESIDHIESLKKECDYVIVLYHGGKEHYRYPSPNLRKRCRKMVIKGADLIICQHSHCIGCYEKLNDSVIVYGQGNFIFNRSSNEYWNSSVLVNVLFDKTVRVEFIPIKQTSIGTSLAVGNDADNIMNDFHSRSQLLNKPGFVEKEYECFSKKNIRMYLVQLKGLNKWMARIDRFLLRGRLLKRMYSKNDFLAIQNYIECESHHELLLAGLKAELKRG